MVSWIFLEEAYNFCSYFNKQPIFYGYAEVTGSFSCKTSCHCPVAEVLWKNVAERKLKPKNITADAWQVGHSDSHLLIVLVPTQNSSLITFHSDLPNRSPASSPSRDLPGAFSSKSNVFSSSSSRVTVSREILCNNWWRWLSKWGTWCVTTVDRSWSSRPWNVTAKLITVTKL